MSDDLASRLWDAETAAYRAAGARGATEAETAQAVEMARLNFTLQVTCEQWRTTTTEMSRGFQQVARHLQDVFVPAMAGLRELAEQKPHLVPEPTDPRERALHHRRTRNTGPAPRRLDGRS